MEPLVVPLPWLSPAERYNAAVERLRRTTAKKIKQELEAKGLRFRLLEGVLRAGPAELVVNGTAATIEQWKGLFVELLKEQAT